MAEVSSWVTHPEYDSMATTWRKLRIVAGGRDALMAGKERYLPKPTKMSPARYTDYLHRAKWFGATKRTVQAFEGLAFRQEPSIETPASMTRQLDTLTSTGVSLTGLARLAFRETLLMGRYGVLVDMDASGTRPFWAGYPAECILNWTTSVVDDQRVLTRVELKETDWVVLATGQQPAAQETIRVLELVDGVYTQTLHVSTGAGVWRKLDALVPQRQHAPLDFIPFAFVGVNDLEATVELSSLNDLADTNLAYWRHSADYEWALHLTANPTPWITGHDIAADLDADGKPQAELVLGSDMAIILREPDARVGMLEFQGHGLDPLRTALTDDKLEMASLGARLLEGQPETGETLGAFRMRQMGDTSVIVALAQSLGTAFTRLLRVHAFWFGAASTPEDQTIRCQLPTNFATSRMEPQALTALLAGVQAGHISQQTLYWNLQQGEMAEPGVDFDEEQARIEAQTPAMVRLLPANGATNGATNGVAAGEN